MDSPDRPGPHEPAQWDIAAYALGVLDPRDIERCEQHLAECPSCAAELEELLPASTVLADVDPEALRQVEDPGMFDRLTCAVVADRRRARRRRRLATAGSTALVATVTVLALFAGANWVGETGSPGPQAGEPTATAGGTPTPDATSPDPGDDGEPFSATDPETGAQADVMLTSRDWGTQVSFELSSVTGPLQCQLLLVYGDGTAEVAGSWRVPPEGYGTDQRPKPLLLEAAVAADRADLAELRITTQAPDGSTGTLVTVPL